jgi:hypothetical protein
MKLIARLSFVALLLPCIQCQAQIEDAELESESASTQAASSTPVTWKLTGTAVPTSVSGVVLNAKDKHVLGDPNSSTAAVWAVRSQELSDEPCFLKVGTEDLNDASQDTWEKKDHCGSAGPNGDLVEGQFPDVSDGGGDDHIFITQVSVCMNAAGTKVKGLMAVGEQLRSDGTTGVWKTFEQERANCDYWSGGASCPVGQVATAVNAYFNGSSQPSDLTGITLTCRTLTY